MPPSKAERIFSRYRPIAPKPLPLPPSGSFGTTDPSSTCASVDSFTTSAKCKKSRKRKADDAVPAKCLKAPRPIASSGVSNTGGVSSLTQGISDGTVPLRDRRSASQISYGSMPRGIEEAVEMSNGASKEAPNGMASDVRFAAYGRVVAPVYVADTSNMVQAQGLYISPETSAHYQQHFTLMHPRTSSGCNPSSVGVMDKDAGFMARAAAASATLMQEKSVSAPVCDPGCAKGGGHAGGSFTEMIRGITRLPTAADVQSLMQARASPSAVIGHPAAASSGTMGLRSSPTSSREVLQPKADPFPLPPTTSHNWVLRSPSQTDVEQVCENDANLVTLPLLPNIPTRMCMSRMASSQGGSPLAQASSSSTPRKLELHPGQTSLSGPHNPEISWHHRVSSVHEPSAVLASRYEPSAVLLGKGIGLTHSDAQLPTRCPPLPTALKRAGDGFVVPSISSPVMQVAASPIMADGAVIDEGYLEQVYGGSEEPVLLVDCNNQVLWFNKPYDRALKSAMERLSGKMITTGPYIDPLGHPTPLGSFLFSVCGKSVRATLWGFLKKLVIQENALSLEKPEAGPRSQLHLSVGESSQRMSPFGAEVVSRMSPVVGSSNSRVTLTVESIMELHMEAPATAESMEAAEARLGMGSDPAYITDCSNRVRWVNSALKQMLHHMTSDGSSLQLGTSCSKGPDPTETTFVMCCTEKVPRSAWAFSCRINLEWMKGGRRRSMTVPCDVSRLASSTKAPEDSWLWQFDMAVSLCLHAPS